MWVSSLNTKNIGLENSAVRGEWSILTLGEKSWSCVYIFFKIFQVHLHKIRTDQYTTEETVTQKDSSNEEEEEKEPEDEFDKLLQQQIELARSTPAPGSIKKHIDSVRENR